MRSAALATDTYEKAVKQRPDHLTSYRLLAYALVREGRFADAFAALESGLQQNFPGGRFASGKRVLSEDLGLVAAAWLKSAPGSKAEIAARLDKAGAKSIKLILTDTAKEGEPFTSATSINRAV